MVLHKRSLPLLENHILDIYLAFYVRYSAFFQRVLSLPKWLGVVFDDLTNIVCSDKNVQKKIDPVYLDEVYIQGLNLKTILIQIHKQRLIDFNLF